MLPVWFIIVEDEHPDSNRYIPQEDIEDELEESADSPLSYQVWVGGKMVFSSTSANDVKKFITRSLPEKSWCKTCIREVTF